MPNPFVPRPHTTVRRARDDVYPQRKGLHEPADWGSTPLDVLFRRLQHTLREPLEAISVRSLAPAVAPALAADAAPNAARYAVVASLLDTLLEIHALAAAAAAAAAAARAPDVVAISLHDMKTFGKLVSVIVVLGVWPALAPLRVGVPPEKRRLKDFGTPSYRAVAVEPVAAGAGADRYAPVTELLLLVYDKMRRVFATPSDVRTLLMKGVGYSDYLAVAITLASAPFVDAATQARVAAEYGAVAAAAATYDLYSDYTLLVATPSPAYFKRFVMAQLQLVPARAPRGDGVLTLVEFVLGLRDGGDISVDRFDHVANVLLQKPAALSSAAYFSAIARQCLAILVNLNRPVIAGCVGHFLERLWLKNPRVVLDFFYKPIWAAFAPPAAAADAAAVLVSEKDLNNTVNMLVSLTGRATPPDMLVALVAPILASLWDYYAFLRHSGRPHEVMQNILVAYFTQISATADAGPQLDHLGRHLVAEHAWKFRAGPNKLVEVYAPDSTVAGAAAETRVLDFVQSVDARCAYFVDLLKQLDGALVQKEFLALLSRWVQSAPLDENPFLKLVDLRLLESIGSELKDSLAQTPLEILQLVEKTLQLQPGARPGDNDSGSDSDDDDDGDDGEPDSVVSVLLQLLSAIISENTAELAECKDVLRQIHTTLQEKYRHMKTAAAVGSRIDTLLRGEQPVHDAHEAQRRTFARAIASLNDPLVPIRAHGLFLLRQLVEENSPVISVDFVVNLHLVQLKDPEPFVYLNVIKGLQSLLEASPHVLPVLLDIYTAGVAVSGSAEKPVKTENAEMAVKTEDAETAVKTEDSAGPDAGAADLDEKLRIGEVLLRFVQARGEAFSGEAAKLVANATLSMIRRPANDSDRADDRLRMSAMSILGTCCNTNVLGIVGEVENALDCSIGILQLETAKDSAIMRRAAIVLMHDLIVGTSNSDKVPFPKAYMSKVLTVLRYVESNDNDLLVREQAASVLEHIDDLVKVALGQ